MSHNVVKCDQRTIRPAFSTFLANVAFSERKPYPATGLAFGVLENRRALTRMYHLHAMFQRNLYDLVSRQVSSHRRVLATFTDHVGFVGFYKTI
jgi:hypothetical protein